MKTEKESHEDRTSREQKKKQKTKTLERSLCTRCVTQKCATEMQKKPPKQINKMVFTCHF